MSKRASERDDRGDTMHPSNTLAGYCGGLIDWFRLVSEPKYAVQFSAVSAVDLTE